MRQLLGGPSVSQEEKLLRELFLQRLPQSMVPVLVAAGDFPLETLAEMADHVADYSRTHSLNAVTTPPPATVADPVLASIENRLDALVRHLDDFVPAHRRPSSRFQIHSRSSTPPRSPDLRPPDAPPDVSSSIMRWYHRRFGASARKCTHPCSWSGKGDDRPLTAASGTGRKSCRLFYVSDKITGACFLVDTGAQVSVIPASCADRHRNEQTCPLQAINNSAIRTYDQRSLTLDLRLRRTSRWIFILADVSQAVLGADFLSFFNLARDMHAHRLIDLQHPPLHQRCTLYFLANRTASSHTCFAVCKNTRRLSQHHEAANQRVTGEAFHHSPHCDHWTSRFYTTPSAIWRTPRHRPP
ncbi:uncharacterized protein LOC142802193 isoform X1 [Rhipicephalus microplus]|uniref:uncharacterized protein LOC142802193 isoform X1 n=1 Tax=Rhipicephalus microplus TaxID=6941 RepID=UPI003F6B3EA6